MSRSTTGFVFDLDESRSGQDPRFREICRARREAPDPLGVAYEITVAGLAHDYAQLERLEQAIEVMMAPPRLPEEDARLLEELAASRRDLHSLETLLGEDDPYDVDGPPSDAGPVSEGGDGADRPRRPGAEGGEPAGGGLTDCERPFGTCTHSVARHLAGLVVCRIEYVLEDLAEFEQEEAEGYGPDEYEPDELDRKVIDWEKSFVDAIRPAHPTVTDRVRVAALLRGDLPGTGIELEVLRALLPNMADELRHHLRSRRKDVERIRRRQASAPPTPWARDPARMSLLSSVQAYRADLERGVERKIRMLAGMREG